MIFSIYETADQQVEVRLEHDNELSEAATTEDFSVVGQEGQRQVWRKLKYSEEP